MSQMVIVLFFTSTSFPAKAPTHMSVVLAVREFWLELGLGAERLCPAFTSATKGAPPAVPLGAPEAPSSLAYFCIDSFQIWNSVFRMNVGFSWVLSKLPLRVSCCWSSAVSSALREAQVRCLQAADAPVPSKSDPLGLIPLLEITYRCVWLNS